MVTKYFCKTDILSMASPGKRNQGRTWTAFCSLFCMPELLPKVGVLLACFFDRYKNFKFINWYLDMTIEYKYNVQCFCLKRILNIIIQAGIFREYRNKCFWRPKCFGKAIPQIMTLQILSGKGAVQIMPLRKLGGKFHFSFGFARVSEVRHIIIYQYTEEFLSSQFVDDCRLRYAVRVMTYRGAR